VYFGAKAAKVAMSHAPVDGSVKKLFSVGVDLVADQAEASPDASIKERIKIGVSS